MEELAAKYQYHFIDCNDELCDENGNQKKEFTKEGLHMFANAYEVVFQNLVQFLKPMVDRSEPFTNMHPCTECPYKNRTLLPYQLE